MTSAQLSLDLQGPEPTPRGWYLRATMALAASRDDVDPQAAHCDGWLHRLAALWWALRVRAFRRAWRGGALYCPGADARAHCARVVRVLRREAT